MRRSSVSQPSRILAHQIAERFNVSPHTVADWKRQGLWSQEMKAIADTQVSETCSEFLAMTPYGR
jgi:uncharacterized protein YjcR